jgi:NADH dehydrogenase
MVPRKQPLSRKKKAPEEELFPPSQGIGRILVTGATGFVGRAVVAELLQRGYQVVALARRQESQASEPGLVRVAADVLGEGWQRWAEGCQAIIHLVGIIRPRPKEGVTFQGAHVEATARVIQVCQKQGIGRLLHMSAVGANPQASTPYHRTKGEAEQLVMASGLAWTIFRPSVIFGPGDGFTTTLAGVIRRFPVVPIFGDGSYPLQPVAVEEVAEAFALSLDNPRAIGQVVELGGPEVLTYLQVLQRVAASLGKRRAFLRLPLPWVRAGVKVLSFLLPNPPITPDELAMLVAGSIADTTLASQLFQLPRKAFQGITWGHELAS